MPFTNRRYTAGMFSSDHIAGLRAVPDEACSGLPEYEIATRALVASKILENAALGDVSVEVLKTAAYRALEAAR